MLTFAPPDNAAFSASYLPATGVGVGVGVESTPEVTSNSEICPPVEPLFVVMLRRTYLLLVLVKVIVTILLDAGLNVYTAEALSVV